MFKIRALLLAVFVSSLSAIPHHYAETPLSADRPEARRPTFDDSPRDAGAGAGGWYVVRRAELTRVVEVTLALRLDPKGVEELRRHFLACSDMNNDKYGRYWSRSMLRRIVTHAPRAAAAAHAWLLSNSFTIIHFPGGLDNGFVRVRGCVSDIQEAFGVDLCEYSHPLLRWAERGVGERGNGTVPGFKATSLTKRTIVRAAGLLGDRADALSNKHALAHTGVVQ
jgi:hypothetical protein